MVRPTLKVRRHIPIIITLLILLTKDLKEGHIIERHSLIDGGVAYFFIQAHHIPAVGVLVIVLIVFYAEGGIDKRVNWYGFYWDVGESLVIIDVEVPID